MRAHRLEPSKRLHHAPCASTPPSPLSLHHTALHQSSTHSPRGTSPHRGNPPRRPALPARAPIAYPPAVRRPSADPPLQQLAPTIARATGARAVRLDERIQSLWSGYGEIRRAELDGTERPSVIIKHVTPPRAPDKSDRENAYSHQRKLRSYRVELEFYRRHAAHCGPLCRVPRALHLASDPRGWLFVLEDLDAAGFGRRTSRPRQPEILAGLRWLAHFHATFLGVEPEGLWPVGTYWHLGTRPFELRRVPDPHLRDAAPALDARLSSARYRTLVHGDAKLENCAFSPDSADVALVDFQYVGGGVGVKDVAYFLSCCLAPAECERQLDAYLDLYFRDLRDALRARPHTEAIDPSALEAEWRALFPLAWVDFYRFLLGWAPGAYDHDHFSQRLTRGVLQHL